MFLDDIVLKAHNYLLTSECKLALAYLVSRGITFEEIKQYKIGYIGKILSNVTDTSEDAQEFNKWIGYKGKFVSNRIVFPIYSEYGNIKGLETRGLDKQALTSTLASKYLISLDKEINKAPVSLLRYRKFYLKNSLLTGCFFGLPNSLPSIWEKKSLFVTEGIFDCISLKKIYPNCISSLTANVNDEQMNWMRRYSNNVILVFDTDKKGKIASEKIKRELSDTFRINSVYLKGSDVNEMLVKEGVKDLKNLIDYQLNSFF